MIRKIALIDCSIPINTRNQKIINSIKIYYPECDVHIITWNREGLLLEETSNFHAYNYDAQYGNAKAKLMGMLGFKIYIKNILKQIHPELIIASHWSNLILAACAKKKGQTLIYENLDIPTGSFIIRNISHFFEKLAIRKVDLIIHASRFFKPLYPQPIPQIILENKPAFSIDFSTEDVHKPLRISFIGSIRYKEILTNLVEAVKNDNRFELYFHGSGEDSNYMQNYSKDSNNVHFTGKYKYKDVIKLYHQSDIVWAAYPNKDFNVKYAISNKFHESLYVGVPCIYSDQTKLADLVNKNRIGFVVNPYDKNCIKALFIQLYNGTKVINKVKENMKKFQNNETTWDEDFQNFKTYLE